MFTDRLTRSTRYARYVGRLILVSLILLFVQIVVAFVSVFSPYLYQSPEVWYLFSPGLLAVVLCLGAILLSLMQRRFR